MNDFDVNRFHWSIQNLLLDIQYDKLLKGILNDIPKDTLHNNICYGYQFLKKKLSCLGRNTYEGCINGTRFVCVKAMIQVLNLSRKFSRERQINV